MYVPLAEKLRPQSFAEIAGHASLIGSDGILTQIIQQKKPLSILLWGPPGSGKTTIAKLYAKAFDAHFLMLSGTQSSVQDLKKLNRENSLFHPVVFMDEIHRFNKAQQDAFLPLVEQGLITLVGATTENPSFSLNNALLSRLRVFKVPSLDEKSLNQILCRYEEKIEPLPLTEEARHLLIDLSSGDGRHLINMLENLQGMTAPIEKEQLFTLIQRKPALYDRKDDGHYNLISALHKAVRGSDPDASLYWFARMLEGGEDPRFIARRVIRMATEDIGLADPDALQIALHAAEAYERQGSPEGDLALAEAVLYLALAPKSNRVYIAFEKAKKIAKETSHLNPPLSILNAPTKLMKQFEYGKGYQYDHHCENAFSGAHYFPEEMERICFYEPVKYGFEREMQKRIDYFNELRVKRNLYKKK